MTQTNSINAATTGIVGNTGTAFTGTAVTQYNVLVGGSTSSTLSNIAPSATSGVPLISQGASANPLFGTAVVAGGGTGAASFNVNGVLISNTTTTGALSSLTLTNGQMIIGSTGASPVAGTITSTDGSVTVSTGAGTLNLAVAGGSTAIKTITGNSGGAESPSAGNFNILGTGSITVAGSANTETIQLTGITNHALQVGAGTATLTQLGAGTTGQVLQTNTTADPTWSTATYPSTTTINQILYSSSANTVGGLATTNKGVLTTGATGIPVMTALATDGQLIIGSTAGAPAAATLSAGTGITITNGSNSIGLAVNGSVVGQTITGTSGGALSPTAGNWNILGASTAAGITPVTTSGSVSTLTVNVQKAQAIASTDATKVGLAAFNSTNFSVDANGFVGIPAGTDVIKTLTGNSGGALSPTSGNINTLGTGSITVAGSGSTLTTQLTGLTNHAIQIGAGTATLTQLGAGTTGQILQTNTTADPTWSTATYPSTATSTGTILRADGTNWAATTATYPATTTSQQILYSSSNNVVGQLTTANSSIAATNSSGTLAMRAFSVVSQVFTSNGTYTPTSGMLYCVIECVGGGGAGGGCGATGASQVSVGGGGGGGEYTRGIFSAATIGASKGVTIGAAGTGVNGAGGNNGGTTSVGATTISALGGTGGSATAAAGTPAFGAGGGGGSGGAGVNFSARGGTGLVGLGTVSGGFTLGGQGGSSFFCLGGGNGAQRGAGGAGGSAGGTYGGGGGGAANGASTAAQTGGDGGAGIVVITEYVIA